MTKFERWFINRVFKRIFRQGYTHQKNITEVYRMVNDAVYREFTEDNGWTHRAFLKECFEDAMSESLHENFNINPIFVKQMLP